MVASLDKFKSNGIESNWAAAILVFAALGFLILVKRGFRGVTVGGVSVGVR